MGITFLDRGIPQAVASETGPPEKAVAEVDDEPRTRIERLAASVGRHSTVNGAGGGSLERLDLQERALRGGIEEVLARRRASGGVVLGRGGMVVLRSVPWALHVHLRGPREARVRQGAAIAGVDDQTARRQQKAEDKARRDYEPLFGFGFGLSYTTFDLANVSIHAPDGANAAVTVTGR